MPKAKEPLTANDLRWFGETADGSRDAEMVLVKHNDGTIEVVSEVRVLGDDSRIAKVKTKSKGPGIKGNVEIQIVHNGRVIKLPKADAVFVTQSAVEKFVLPYYMRMKSAAQVGAIENELFNNAGIIAAEHIPPSDIDGISKLCAVKEDGSTDVHSISG